MSFDYGSDSNKLNLPNPMRVENIFLSVCGVVLLLGGLILLVLIKNSFAVDNAMHYKITAIFLAVGMLLCGVSVLGWAMRQLRFFFGRGRPASLAGEVANGMQGKSNTSDDLVETLRQQALHYEEPQGALSNLLHSMVPNLIFAPSPIRNLALLHFKKGIGLVLILFALTLSLVGGKTNAAEWAHIADWIGVAFMAYVIWMLLAPSQRALSLTLREAEQSVSPQRLVAMLVAAIIGPVLLLKIAPKLPDISWLNPYPQVFILLVLALMVYGVFYLALLRNVKQPPNTVVSNQQSTWSINCNPGLVLEEFAREMQTSWQEKIPNRVYARMEPDIDLNAKAGKFKAEALEETQPMPLDATPITFAVALSTPRLQPLVWLDLIASVFIVIATVLLTISGGQMLHMNPETLNIQLLIYGIVLLSLGLYALRSAHQLWQRFEFKSQLVYLEMIGHYTTASLDHGNVLRDAIKTNSHVVQIESMTFRLWFTELTSVTFSNNPSRYMLSMAGNAERAAQMQQHYKNFAESQAIIMAPKSKVDQQRHAALSQFNQDQSGIGTNESAVLLPQPDGSILPIANTEIGIKRPKFCGECGAAAPESGNFCAGCGVKLAGV